MTKLTLTRAYTLQAQARAPLASSVDATCNVAVSALATQYDAFQRLTHAVLYHKRGARYARAAGATNTLATHKVALHLARIQKRGCRKCIAHLRQAAFWAYAVPSLTASAAFVNYVAAAQMYNTRATNAARKFAVAALRALVPQDAGALLTSKMPAIKRVLAKLRYQNS